MTLGPHTALISSELEALRAATTVEQTVELFDAVIAELRQPLRIAVTGRVNAGKSTLVNALLGQRIAPTDVSECTKYAAWFRFGTPERVEVVGPDGTRRPVALRPDGRLPAALGDLNDLDVARIDVFLSNEVLRDFTLIDTPGLASSRGDVQVTDEILALDRRSRTALAQADAMLFVVAGDIRANEYELLGEFQRLTGGLSPSSVNTLAVLSRVDQAVDLTVDPVAAALPRCDALAAELRAAVSHVLPVVGLLAETADCGVLTDADLAGLTRMVTDRPRFDRALTSVDRFVRSDLSDSTETERGHLLDLLDLHGLRLLADRIAGDSATGSELVAEIRRQSGIDAVRSAVSADLASHADLLKASWAIGGLQDLAYRVDPIDRHELLNLAERLELGPELHKVAEMAALREVAAGHADLASVDVDELRRLVHGQTSHERLGVADHIAPEKLPELARDAVNRWRAAGNDGSASPSLRSIAATLARSYELMLAEIGTTRHE